MSGDGVDPTAQVDPTAIVGPRCQIGAGAMISAGAYLQADVTIGAGVTVGPNSVFVRRDFGDPTTVGTRPHQGIDVHDGVQIGANATVLGGVTIERHAVVGAGSVITRAVPAYAIVIGNPARVVGYASSPSVDPTRRLLASTLDSGDLPLALGKATALKLPVVVDVRGALTYGEFPGELPFIPERCFLVHQVPSPEVRGEHAHRELHELLICVHGEVAVVVDDGEDRGEVVLDRSDVALHIPPMVWTRQYGFSADAVLLVLASAPYAADDYVRDYDDFRVAVAGARSTP